MHRIVIFGNSGSGKSSLAKRLSEIASLPHLDLDDIAWKQSFPPIRESLNVSLESIESFIAQNPHWVIEGCYSSLIEHAIKRASQIFFLNLGVDECIRNCRSRPWEPHKYASKAEQDRNLEMLVDWVSSYETRDDEFSLKEHQQIFDLFDGEKREIKSNEEGMNIAIGKLHLF